MDSQFDIQKYIFITPIRSKEEYRILREGDKIEISCCCERTQKFLRRLYDFKDFITELDFDIFKESLINHPFHKLESKEGLLEGIIKVKERADYINHADIRAYFLECMLAELKISIEQIRWLGIDPTAKPYFEKKWNELITKLDNTQMEEKDIYSLSNLHSFVNEPFTFRETYNELTEDERIKAFFRIKAINNRPFQEMSSIDYVDKITEILHQCYEKWIVEANKMRGKRKYDTLESIFFVFYQLSRYTPQNVWLSMAVEQNKEYFEEYRDEVEAILQAIESGQNEVVKATEKQPIASPINHFNPSMPLNIAIEHFKVFTTVCSRNGKPFLSDNQFQEFIKRAFNNDITVKKQTFNQSPHKEKLFIVKRFYQFYDLGVKDYEQTSQCQEKYIKLLTDNFEGWEYANIKNNFGKTVKRDW